MSIGFVDHISIGIKTEDVISNRTSSSTFKFMLVSKQRLSGISTSIIQNPIGQNSQQSRLSSVYVADNSYTHFYEITFAQILSD